MFIDVSGVEKLRSYSIGSEIVLGGNVSLTETMDILTNASNKSGFEYTKHLSQHIDLIANVPVRNVSILRTVKNFYNAPARLCKKNLFMQAGTIAGNLSIKHANIEFPSDLFLILETAGAKLTIAESPQKTTVISVADYLYFNMDGKIILNVILPALNPKVYTYRSYKVTSEQGWVR